MTRRTPSPATPVTLEPLEPRLLLSGTPEQQALELFSVSPALFVENQGQWADEAVRFVHDGAGADVAMTDSGPVFQVFRQVPREGAAEAPEDGLDGPFGPDPMGDPFGAEPPETEVLRFSASFLGASAVTPVGLDRSDSYFNYFVGDEANWHSEVPAYERVAYSGLYDGIDLYTWGQRDSLKYEFHVAPGADYSRIQVQYSGIEGLSLAEDGSLLVDLGEGWGGLTDDAPFIYQTIGGERVEVAGAFSLVDSDTYTFQVTGPYDPARDLVIDPDLAWSTYLGGNDDDYGYGVAVDASGAVVVTGRTRSAGWTSGGFDCDYNGAWDAFVAKLTPSGGHAWSTYLGGNDDDSGRGVAVDSSGAVVVTGRTRSAGWTSSGFDTSYNGGGRDAFVAKLTPSGGHAWSTYLGGTNPDLGTGVAVDASGAVVVTGFTESAGWTSGGFDTTHGGGEDAFVAKLTPSGGHDWSTYLGGNANDTGHGVAVDASGAVVVTGWTTSAGWTSGGFDTSYNGDGDAFVCKLTPSGGHAWSTYLGGSSYDYGYGVAVDASGAVVVTGYTWSAGWTSGGFDTSLGGGPDAFVAKLTPSGGHAWSTYLGGNDYDRGSGVAVDASGAVVVTGRTGSAGWTSGGFDCDYNGSGDAFVAKLTPSGGHAWSTYLGGNGEDHSTGVAVDSSGAVVVAGGTYSAGWTSGGFDTSYNGGGDAFVAKLTPSGGHAWSTYLGGNDDDWGYNVAVDSSGAVVVTGLTYSAGWTSGGFDTSHNGYSSDAFVAKIRPGGSIASVSPGTAVGRWGTSNAAGDTEASHWTDGGGMVLDPSILSSGVEVSYQFAVPEPTLPVGSMTGVTVSVYGRGLDWAFEPALLVGPEGERLELTGALPEAEGWSGVFEVPLDKLVEAPGNQPGYLLDVVLDVGYLDAYDVRTVRTSYTYEGIDLRLMQGYQTILDGTSQLIDFYDNIAVDWPIAAMDDEEIRGILMKLVPGVGDFLTGDSPLLQAFDAGTSLVNDFDVLAETLGFAFDWTGFFTQLTLGFGSQTNSAYQRMVDLSDAWRNSIGDDGYVSDDEAGDINSAISEVQGRIENLEGRLLDVRNEIKTRVLNDPYEDPEVVNYAQLALQALSAMLRFDPETGDGPLENSYLPALRGELDRLRQNRAPSGISLSDAAVAENQPSGTVVGTFDTSDPGESGLHSYALVAGPGGEDNDGFVIDGDALETSVSFDYEEKSTYSIRVRSTDEGGLYTEDTFTISVTNVNEGPTNIALSSDSVVENQPAGTVVGTFSASDPDEDNTFTYALVSGSGSADNGSFTLAGNTLKTAEPFDYETKDAYSIRVRSTDQGALFTEETFTIAVTDVDDTPPVVTGQEINEGLGQRSKIVDLRFLFSESVDVSADALALHNDTTGEGFDLSAVPFDEATCTWETSGVALTDGNYTATLTAGGVEDTAGNPMAKDYQFTFHVLKGDATGDAKTNIFDLLKVRQNYLKPADDPDRDDNADVTGDGNVNIFDLLMVRQNYLRELEEPVGGASASMVLAAETSPQPVALSSESGGSVALADYAELSVLTQEGESSTGAEESAEGLSASGGSLDFEATVLAADPSASSDETLPAHELDTDVAATVYPVGEDSEPAAFEGTDADSGLADVLAVPALDIGLDA